MDKLAFVPMIDVPLTALIVTAFTLNFNRWSRRRNVDTTVDLPSRLPVARLRVIVLWVCVLALCWFANLAVWSIVVLFLLVGVPIAIVLGGDASGVGLGLFAAAIFIREWAFGFPQLILHPPVERTVVSRSLDTEGEMVGQHGITISPLRPIGDANFDGRVMSVTSESGQFLDAGTEVTVTDARNRTLRVRPVARQPKD